MSYEYLVYETIDQVARLTLNRPEKLNALSLGLPPSGPWGHRQPTCGSTLWGRSGPSGSC